jgi:dihydrolipoamide dehydrogenase
MSQHFEIAVIGSGPGGYVAALKAAQLGASVAVVEQHPFFGGTCLNWGCIPSKALLASAELKYHIEHAADMGIEVQGQVSHNWPKIQQRKDKILATLRTGIKGLFAARKVTPFQGLASLDGQGKIVVKQGGQVTAEFTANKVILATGSVPTRIPTWPNDERVCTSDEALHWKELPKKVLIVGGGVIGCEFACFLQPFGVEVVIVELMPQLLPGMDSLCAETLKKVLEKRGIKIYLGTKVEDLQLTDTGTAAKLSNGETIAADKVLTSVGRRPFTQGLGLETVGLTTDRGFIRVNDQMETSVKGYYCIGDANGRVLLAHAASAHGVVAAENALGASHSFHEPVPGCIYTFPEIAAVGLTDVQAREQGIPVKLGGFRLGTLAKAMAVNDTEGFVKIVRHRETDEILGVHMMGHNVTEIIASATVLLSTKAKAHEAAEIVFAHPTISEGFKEAIEDTFDACLHAAPKKVVRVTVGA